MTSIFHQIIRFVGLDSTHPPAPGCYTVSSTHFRFPAQKLKPQSLSVYSQIFYPSADPSSSSIQRKPYVRPGVIEGLSKWTGVNKAAFALIGASIHPLLPDLDPIPPSQSKENKNGIESANNQNNNRSSNEGKFPIVIFSHGLGGNCEIYMNICKDIASHGYIVIALEHADGSGSYAKSIEINQASAESGGVTSGLDITNENEIDVFYKFPPKDMQYEREAVVQFRKPFIDHRIEELRSVFSFIESASDKPKCFQYGDSSFLFLAGHSFGATSTVMATNQDDIVSKIKGAVLFDLWPFPLPRPIVDKGMRVPFISILSETFASGAEVKLTDKLINNSSDVLKLSYYVQGTVHQSFSDGPWFIRSQWLGKKANMIGELDRDVAMNTIVNATCSLFLQSVQASASTSIVDSGADLFTQGKESKFLEVNKYLKPFSFAKIQQELGSKQDKPRM